MITLSCAVHSPLWPCQETLHTLCESILGVVAAKLQLETINSELSLVFTNDEEIRILNKQWRLKDKATNVLSFPLQPLKPGQKPGPLLGDIIFAHQTIFREAAEQNKTFQAHFIHLFIHGFLHLLGYDHETPKDATTMETLEKELLSCFSIKDPYELS